MGQRVELKLKSIFSSSDPALTRGRSHLLLALQGGNSSLIPGLDVSPCFCKCEGEDLAALAPRVAALDALQLCWSVGAGARGQPGLPYGHLHSLHVHSTRRPRDALQQEAEPVP